MNQRDNNEYASNILVFAVRTLTVNGVESLTSNLLKVQNAAPYTPGGLDTTILRRAVKFDWLPNDETDLSHYSYRTKVETDSWSSWVNTTDVSYTRNLTTTEITDHGNDGNDITIYFEIKAVDLFRNESSANSIDANTIVFTLDDVPDSTTYGKVLNDAINASGLVLLDETVEGSYGKVLITGISAGQIILAQTSGDLDDVTNGASYGKVLLTNISAGKIILAECDNTASTTPVDAGLYIGADHMGYYNASVWKTYIDNSGNFYLGGDNGPLIWTAGTSTLEVDGGSIVASNLSVISADMGTITAGLAKSSDDKIQLDLNNKWLKVWDASATPVLRVHLGFIS